MKVFVTGAAGFIGSHLCERLLNDGCEIVGIDSFDEFYDPRIKRRNIDRCLKDKHFQLVEADIRDRDAMDQAMDADVDVIVHLAARAGVRPSIAEPVLYADVNINGTMVLLEAAKKYEIDKFIFASSSSVYGNNEKVPFSEEDNVDFPISPYAATKKAGELICHTYQHLYGISITCLRFFTVYGPRQRPDLAIHKFARLIEAGQPIPVFGDGSMMRDFTYIDDIIAGVTAAMEKCNRFHIYNLGESQPISVNDLIGEIEIALGKKAVKDYLPPQPGDVERTYADVTKAMQDLGYRPSTPIQTGLSKFAAWLRQEETNSN
ncbi:MAG: GDP-mannose 4,6-dehydratase [Sedimentisphaerales bacterium]|nr:GDP-mannose 4,6-dehydratase [Sedimentisphaerales bacterium]